MKHRDEITEGVTVNGRVAVDRLIPLVYDDLRAFAGNLLASHGEGEAIHATTLAHEAYLRLVDQTRATFASKGHFLAIASMVIRRILVDFARQRKAQKRGGDAPMTTLHTNHLADDCTHVDVLALHDALEQLAKDEPRAARLVELRFFAGMPIEDAARVLEISTATAERDWRFARAWLYQKLG